VALKKQAGDALATRKRSTQSLTDTKPPSEPSGKGQPAPVEKPTAAEVSKEAFGFIPIRATMVSHPLGDLAELRHYYPVTRRDMQYQWRYLRRMIADGPRDVLDVETTVAQTACQGFYYAPVFQRRERNHAHLVLMLDHLGSMVPFHHYLRDLAETALYDSSLGRVDVYYFYNVPGDSLYMDPLLKEHQRSLSKIEQEIGEFTAVMIVSDGGAARRHNELGRVSATLEFLNRMRTVTSYVAWLNPMPKTRWQGTSAEVISRYIAMFPMSADGLSNAMDVLRGLRPSTPQ
jgi:uncharacterized protein with von Willebrand factor type A (vWA) domain